MNKKNILLIPIRMNIANKNPAGVVVQLISVRKNRKNYREEVATGVVYQIYLRKNRKNYQENVAIGVVDRIHVRKNRKNYQE